MTASWLGERHLIGGVRELDEAEPVQAVPSAQDS
jgi:hypothetical protein